MKKIKNQWFTLVELIVVITILAILWTIAFLSLQWYSATSRDSVRISDMKTMKTWLELFHLKAWKYPLPSSYTEVTYSWWIAWYQWTFWDSVTENIHKINETPIDPLNEVEYTYSITSTKQEYELAWSLEWDLALNNVRQGSVLSLLSDVNADWTKNWIAYTAWNYNGQILKVSTWWLVYLLALPTIVTSDTSIPTVEDIVTNNKLVFKWYKNLPSSYEWTSFKVAWETNLNLVSIANVEVYNWATLPTTTQEISTMMTNLKQAYVWTSLENNQNYQDIVNLDTSDQSAITILWNNIVNNWFWTSIEPTWWVALDPNCWIDDIVIWTQTWAWCNSTLWNGFEWGKQDDWTDWIISSCYDYDWVIVSTWTCAPWDTLMASSTKANTWFTGTNTNDDTEVANIWWKLYTWGNRDSACGIWYHVPSDSEWETLETTLNGWTNCRNASNGWLCDGLWWNGHNAKTSSNNMVQALKLPIAGRRNTDGVTFSHRGLNMDLWSSTPSSSSAYRRHLYWSNSAVHRRSYTQSYGFSIRCIKD